jgi:hypothetical protein
VLEFNQADESLLLLAFAMALGGDFWLWEMMSVWKGHHGWRLSLFLSATTHSLSREGNVGPGNATVKMEMMTLIAKLMVRKGGRQERI